METAGKKLLEVKDLRVRYRRGDEYVCALNGLDLDAARGEKLGLVGETGAGKTTLALSILGLLPERVGEITGGSIVFSGDELLEQGEAYMLGLRGRRVSMIFQDPMTSLNPIMTIGSQITSVIMKHQNVSEIEARKRAIVLMKKVGIPNAENRFDDYPFQYSGGMRQRIVIAIALSCQPRILICDEPTTALDVTIQAQIIKLIKDLQKEFGYTIVFITHDLGVVANVADRVAVLYAGQIVELGTVEEVFYDPRHPYTWALLSSLPQLGVKGEPLFSIQGTPPNLFHEVKGDAFAPRNPQALKIDFLVDPPYFEVSPTHKARTWLLDPRAPKLDPPESVQALRRREVRV